MCCVFSDLVTDLSCAPLTDYLLQVSAQQQNYSSCIRNLLPPAVHEETVSIAQAYLRLAEAEVCSEIVFAFS